MNQVRRLCRSRLPGLSLCMLLLSATALPAAEPELRVQEPRPFGHTVGDVLERKLTLIVPAPYTLPAESLPKKGRLHAGLELRDVSVESHRHPAGVRHELRLGYQIFAAPTAVRTISLPPVRFRLARVEDGQPPPVLVADEWPVFVAPLVGDDFLASSRMPAFRAAIRPVLIDTGERRRRLAGIGLVALLLAATLAWRHVAHFLPGRRQLPFAAACGDLSRLRGDASPEAFRQALRRFHRAIDETAGGTVFAANAGDFFAANPRYTGQRAAIEAFFARSQREFFAVGAVPEATDLPWLFELCRECRRLERSGP